MNKGLKMGLFDKLFGGKKRPKEKLVGEKGKSTLEETKRKEEKYEKTNKNELDNSIEKLEFIPDEYREDLVDGLIRPLGPGKKKLSCICLIRSKDYFKSELDDNVKVEVRFTLTATPYNRPVLASYIKIFDSDNPAVDEMLFPRDEYLKRMLEKDYTYLLIANSEYKIYYRRKIYFDNILREDLNKIKKAFERYGEESGKTTLGEDPTWLSAIVWYQNNVSMEEIDRKYFSK